MNSKLLKSANWILLTIFLSTVPGLAESQSDGTCIEHYTVQPGDTYAKIARWRKKILRKNFPIFGHSGMMQRIARLNTETLPDPNKLSPGTVIRLPEDIASWETKSACVAKNSASGVTPVAAVANREAVPERAPTSVASTQTQGPSVAPKTETSLPREASKEDAEFPEDFKIVLGVAGMSIDQSLRFPDGSVELGFGLGKNFGISLGTDAVQTTYGGFVSVLESSTHLMAEYEVIPNLDLGFGYRYFTFGYTNPVGAPAFSHELVAGLSTHFKPFKQAVVKVGGQVRFPLAMGGMDPDVFSAPSTVGSVGLSAEMNFLLGKHFFMGPYYFYEQVNLSWTQAGAYSGPNSFATTEFGTGLHVGFGL